MDPTQPPEWIDVEVTLTRRLRIAKGTEKAIMDTLGMAIANAGSYPGTWSQIYSFQKPTDLEPIKAALHVITDDQPVQGETNDRNMLDAVNQIVSKMPHHDDCPCADPDPQTDEFDCDCSVRALKVALTPPPKPPKTGAS
jgi:hypothetical protein